MSDATDNRFYREAPHRSSKELACIECPFCGYDGTALVGMSTDDRGDGYIIQCDHCGAEGPHSKTREEACDAWNKRHAHEPPVDPLGAETRAATPRGAHSTGDAGRPQPPPPPDADAALDRAYYNGAKQALAMANDSIEAANKWLADGCGGRRTASTKEAEL